MKLRIFFAFFLVSFGGSQNGFAGFGDRLSVVDDRFEGLMLVEKENDYWWYKQITPEQAYEELKKGHHLSVNGSGNDVTSGMHAARIMAEEVGLTRSVHYFLPQRANLVAYSLANNKLAIATLKYFTSVPQWKASFLIFKHTVGAPI